ncbi:hypothetical protein QH639_22285 [Lysinibacillus sp. 1 U-2021]|uniref:hypothetical protein n=1 Tax=Lysinibacillus sp. 1 U-2021 TaxID=3039426 RepID=UPI00248000A6|nr:hypothetical protein [Lysinibacillus sp. 1 U-2021]WGT38504.1 hypothetical protein QH639_22285 [Lysinibacillus sp. 1 U-2021]
MLNQREQSIQRLSEVFSTEQIAAVLIGVLEGIAKYKGEDKTIFVNRWIDSTVNQLTKR